MAKDKKRAAAAAQAPSLYERFETWAGKKDRTIFYVLFALCLLLSFISFNTRISEAHDDALYLEGGSRFVKEFPTYFYTQNAPLYPLFLAALILAFGFKLVVFKLFSVVFTLTAFVLFYRTFRGRVPAIIFIPVAIFHACNYLIIYYASMTFTEAFYFFLQNLFFFFMVRIIDLSETERPPLSYWKTWLLLGLSMFLVSTGKSAAIVVIPAVLLFFVLEKKWVHAACALGSYLVFKVLYELIVRLVWSAPSQFAGQSKILMQKDPYDASLGKETAGGFIARFFENTNLSFSKRFYQLLGWRDENSTDVYWILTIITAFLILAGFQKFYKERNRVMIVLSFFTGAQLVLSFVILQTRWDQPRITLVLMPVMLLLAFYAIYKFTFKSSARQLGFLVILFFVVGSTLISSFKRGKNNLPILSRNLKGDRFYGYTEDWQNFLKASAWCADSLPDSALVASRKAPMSFVYAHGKHFYPIYSVIAKDSTTNQSNPDSALAILKRNKVTHVIMASLRLDPNRNTGQVINTIHNILLPVARKYPDKLVEVKVFGQSEPAAIYEIKY